MNQLVDPGIVLYDAVRIRNHPEWGTGEVLKVAEELGVYRAKVVFKTPDGEHIETVPLEWLEKASDLWERLARSEFDSPRAYRLKQMALDIAYANTGGELSASRVNLLPHQILLVHDLVVMSPRRMLVADEVGLGKTIETGMLIRELIARGDAERILIVTPAGLIENWRRELEGQFRLLFDVLGRDFQDHGSATWERHGRVIASIDTLKQPRRLQRLLAAPMWDMVIFDEAHHLSRTRSGKKTVVTQNYRLAEALRNHTRDLLFLSATPHQGNTFQFWSLLQLLNDQLFPNAESIAEHRGLLGRVMIRRTKREVTDANGQGIFRKRAVITDRFSLGPRDHAVSRYLRAMPCRATCGPCCWRGYMRPCHRCARSAAVRCASSPGSTMPAAWGKFSIIAAHQPSLRASRLLTGLRCGRWQAAQPARKDRQSDPAAQARTGAGVRSAYRLVTRDFRPPRETLARLRPRVPD